VPRDNPQLLINQERGQKSVIAGVDRLTPNVSQFKQGDILAMPGMGRATSRTDDLMMTPSLNVPSPKPTSSQMNPSVASSGSLFDAFKS
jgi:hypothetical protein